MRILIISQYFWPETFRINDLCSELVKRNHQVTVLTGKPNYPNGSVYPEYRKNPSEFSQYEGAAVIRVPMVSRGQGSSFQLLVNYLSFALFASLWGWIKFRKSKFDVIFVFEPSPVTVGLPAVLLSKAMRIPVVFWALDLWPETLEAVGIIKSKFLLKLIGKLVSFIYNRCDLVLGQSKTFLDGIALYCCDREKIKYFPSWAEEIFSRPVEQRIDEITKINNSFKVLFAGNVGEAQDFPSIIRAAEVLRDSSSAVKIFIVGEGRMSNWVKQQVAEKNLQNYVCLLGQHPLEAMPSFYASADALLVCLKGNPIFAMTVPGKVQTYMMAGKPILAMLDGEGARIIDESNAGYTCLPGNYELLAGNILKMSKLSKEDLLNFGENSKTYGQREFGRNKLVSQLEEWFEELVVSKKQTGSTL